MEGLLSWMKHIEDARRAGEMRHKLKDILMIVLFATLANADDRAEMELKHTKGECCSRIGRLCA